MSPDRPRAIIAEDEPLLAQQLKALLGRIWPALDVRGLAANGLEALELIQRERPQVAFLDIRMPGLTGLEVAAELADRLGAAEAAPAIVFVTAYDEFALKAFDLAAVDYLLKPVTEERLAKAVARLQQRLASPATTESLVSQLREVLKGTPERRPASPLRIVRAGAGATVQMIAVEDICYFQASDKYTAVYTADAESLIRVSIRELLEQLAPERFAQVHRGTIVNLAEVAAAVRDDAGRLSLKLKHRKELLPVSRVYAELFRQM